MNQNNCYQMQQQCNQPQPICCTSNDSNISIRARMKTQPPPPPCCPPPPQPIIMQMPAKTQILRESRDDVTQIKVRRDRCTNKRKIIVVKRHTPHQIICPDDCCPAPPACQPLCSSAPQMCSMPVCKPACPKPCAGGSCPMPCSPAGSYCMMPRPSPCNPCQPQQVCIFPPAPPCPQPCCPPPCPQKEPEPNSIDIQICKREPPPPPPCCPKPPNVFVNVENDSCCPEPCPQPCCPPPQQPQITFFTKCKRPDPSCCFLKQPSCSEGLNCNSSVCVDECGRKSTLITCKPAKKCCPPPPPCPCPPPCCPEPCPPITKIIIKKKSFCCQATPSCICCPKAPRRKCTQRKCVQEDPCCCKRCRPRPCPTFGTCGGDPMFENCCCISCKKPECCPRRPRMRRRCITETMDPFGGAFGTFGSLFQDPYSCCPQPPPPRIRCCVNDSQELTEITPKLCCFPKKSPQEYMNRSFCLPDSPIRETKASILRKRPPVYRDALQRKEFGDPCSCSDQTAGNRPYRPPYVVVRPRRRRLRRRRMKRPCVCPKIPYQTQPNYAHLDRNMELAQRRGYFDPFCCPYPSTPYRPPCAPPKTIKTIRPTLGETGDCKVPQPTPAPPPPPPAAPLEPIPVEPPPPQREYTPPPPPPPEPERILSSQSTGSSIQIQPSPPPPPPPQPPKFVAKPAPKRQSIPVQFIGKTKYHPILTSSCSREPPKRAPPKPIQKSTTPAKAPPPPPPEPISHPPPPPRGSGSSDLKPSSIDDSELISNSQGSYLERPLDRDPARTYASKYNSNEDAPPVSKKSSSLFDAQDTRSRRASSVAGSEGGSYGDLGEYDSYQLPTSHHRSDSYVVQKVAGPSFDQNDYPYENYQEEYDGVYYNDGEETQDSKKKSKSKEKKKQSKEDKKKSKEKSNPKK